MDNCKTLVRGAGVFCGDFIYNYSYLCQLCFLFATIRNTSNNKED